MITKYIGKHGVDAAALDFAKLMPWGTPDQVLEKLSTIRTMIDANGFMLNFSYAGMPYDEAERNVQLFAKKVLPEIKKWDTEPLADPAEFDARQYAAA
jgi:alkanesulfonate monooxygenase SsuD/methylene tetrahydromethanopterin reductase-like flavin-dependent oxidoreductase (luciferase family)